jgi:hypothetical protein
MRRAWWWSVAVVHLLAVPACGDSFDGSDDDGGAGGKGGSASGSGGMSGDGGSSTGGSTTGGSATGGSSTAGTATGGTSSGGSAGSSGGEESGGEGGDNQGGESGSTIGGRAGSAGMSMGGSAGSGGASAGAGTGGGGTGGIAGSAGSSGAGAGGKAGAGGSGGNPTVPIIQASAGDLIVSEIMRDPAKVDDTAGEWFELYNTTSRPYDLNGMTITDNAGSAVVSQSVVVGPSGYVVFARAGTGNGGVSAHYVYGSAIQLANGADFVRLSAAATVLDEVAYDGAGAFPDVPGASLSLRANRLNASANDVAANWCAAGTAFGSGDMGTPGAANGGCLKGVAEMVPGDLVVTEIMVNPSAVVDEVGEWFEVKNPTNLAFNLAGLVVRDQGTDTFTVSSAPLLIAPNGRLVFGVSAATATNGGVTVNYAYDRATFALANTTDEVVLATTITVDQLDYDATFPITAGATLSLRPASETATENDTAANWCAGTTVYGAGDRGTPGATNNACN